MAPLSTMPTPRSAGLLAGMVTDGILGDPRRGHPVALFGRAALAVERRWYADSRAAGVGHCAVLVGGAAAFGAIFERMAGPAASTAVATWAVVGSRSLSAEAMSVSAALTSGDLALARERLPALCGRDPASCDTPELTRAVVESVAENTSDAVVAPLFWGAVAGVPGLLAYRAVNTLDAMVGHRSPRYCRFGWAAARLDDVANWIPARLTALLACACAPLADGTVRGAWRALRRDGARHPSPNAGRCEAAFAGALGVRLGGTNRYGTRVEHRPHLGTGAPPVAADVRRAVRLSAAVSASAAVLAALVTHARTRR